MQTQPVENPSAAPRSILEVRGLKTHFFTRAGVVKAVDGVDLHLAEGEILGLVGESGSGKSITGFSLMGLLDPPGRIVDGELQQRERGARTLGRSPRRSHETGILSRREHRAVDVNEGVLAAAGRMVDGAGRRLVPSPFGAGQQHQV